MEVVDKEFVSRYSAITGIFPVVAQDMLWLLKDGRRQNLDEQAERSFRSTTSNLVP